MTWHKLADHIDEIGFGENQIAVVEAAGKKFCLGRHGDRLFAFAQKCPHAGGLLSEGFIDARGYVVCPLHRYRFDGQTGRNVSGEGFYLRHWPVELREDGVYVGMEKGGGWNLFG